MAESSVTASVCFACIHKTCIVAYKRIWMDNTQESGGRWFQSKFKQHHVRFFPQKADGDKNAIVPPATQAETGVTQPYENDFYWVRLSRNNTEPGSWSNSVIYKSAVEDEDGSRVTNSSQVFARNAGGLGLEELLEHQDQRLERLWHFTLQTCSIKTISHTHHCFSCLFDSCCFFCDMCLCPSHGDLRVFYNPCSPVDLFAPGDLWFTSITP